VILTVILEPSSNAEINRAKRTCMNQLGRLKVDVKKALKKGVDSMMNLTPYTRNILRFRTHFVPPGHYYSPIPDVDEIIKNEAELSRKRCTLLAVDLNEKGQLDLLEQLKQYYPEMPFKKEPSPKYR
jgi:hypothetical protein